MTNDLFTIDAEARTIRGLLIPFGEMSRPSITAEPVMFTAASGLTLPADPGVATLYDNDHDRFEPRGRGVEFERTDAGVVATFSIARDENGDALLSRAEAAKAAGKPLRLSAEIKSLVRASGVAVSGILTGASIATEGAFASAALFSTETSAHEAREYTDEHGVTWRRVEDSTTVHDDDGTSTTTTTVVESVTTDKADEAEPQEEESALMTATTIVPGQPAAPAALSLNGLFSAIARQDPDALRQYREAGDLFALATVQHSGPSAVTIGTDTQRPDYLGELWTRAPYNRRYVPLLQQAALTSWNMKGWRWVEGKRPEVADYSGNTAEVPSNAVDTEPVDVSASRLAGGHRLDRRYTDFNDQEVVASYLINQAEDYKRKTDAKALAAVLAAATTTAPGTVPSGIAKGLAAIVDGALGVIATENSPSYALVDPTLWRDILLTPKDDILAYLETGFGFEQGTGPGFTIRPAATSGKVVVGAKEALTFYELGETPIRVDGVVPGNGSNDVAVFGYWATLTNNGAAIRSVTPAA
ncbi:MULTISPECIES: phage major capsid protein [unclassified Microbacterium]|uniref:phage major capsid protein n=1 Tax=unclassified Microbacterium TaxID=2609290 RepID=UPI003018C394